MSTRHFMRRRRWLPSGSHWWGGVMLACLAAAGCRRAQTDPFAAHRSVANGVMTGIQELQRRRAAIEASQDVLAMLGELRFLRPPPPEPEPIPEPEPTPPVTGGGAAVSPDPTTIPDAGPPKLQGIVRHPREPLAILGGRTVGAGERVGGYVVQNVETDRVVLLSPDGTVVEVRLHESSSSTP